MKKIRLIIVGLLLLIPFMVFQTNAFAKENKKINVYLFRGEGCPHCEEAIEWFENTLNKDNDYSEKYELVKYEVWYDEENSELMGEVANALGTEASGVPFIVIGDKYFSGFSSTESPAEIKSAIDESYNNSDYKDIVKAVKSGSSIKTETEKSSVLPIVIVSAVAIVVVIGLIFFTKEK